MAHAVSTPTPSTAPFTVDFATLEKGLPLSTLEEFAAWSGLAYKDVQEVVIPARTLKHRRQRQEPLNLDESDRLARVARLYEVAIRVFGDREKARTWLTRPKSIFEDKTPIAMMRTDLGGRGVEQMLYQIDEGVFA